jgi:hypothetical protein
MTISDELPVVNVNLKLVKQANGYVRAETTTTRLLVRGAVATYNVSSFLQRDCFAESGGLRKGSFSQSARQIMRHSERFLLYRKTRCEIGSWRAYPEHV